jgi:hypothetical protein
MNDNPPVSFLTETVYQHVVKQKTTLIGLLKLVSETHKENLIVTTHRIYWDVTKTWYRGDWNVNDRRNKLIATLVILRKNEWLFPYLEL